jgi:hypothetical protein
MRALSNILKVASNSNEEYRDELLRRFCPRN